MGMMAWNSESRLLLDRTHSGIALHDVQLAAAGILGAAVDELLHAVGEVHLLESSSF